MENKVKSKGMLLTDWNDSIITQGSIGVNQLTTWEPEGISHAYESAHLEKP